MPMISDGRDGRRRILKSVPADFPQRGGQDQTFQPAKLERLVANLRQAFGEDDVRYLLAVVKFSVLNASEPFAQDEHTAARIFLFGVAIKFLQHVARFLVAASRQSLQLQSQIQIAALDRIKLFLRGNFFAQNFFGVVEEIFYRVVGGFGSKKFFAVKFDEFTDGESVIGRCRLEKFNRLRAKFFCVDVSDEPRQFDELAVGKNFFVAPRRNAAENFLRRGKIFLHAQTFGVNQSDANFFVHVIGRAPQTSFKKLIGSVGLPKFAQAKIRQLKLRDEIVPKFFVNCSRPAIKIFRGGFVVVRGADVAQSFQRVGISSVLRPLDEHAALHRVNLRVTIFAHDHQIAAAVVALIVILVMNFKFGGQKFFAADFAGEVDVFFQREFFLGREDVNFFYGGNVRELDGREVGFICLGTQQKLRDVKLINDSLTHCAVAALPKFFARSAVSPKIFPVQLAQTMLTNFQPPINILLARLPVDEQVHQKISARFIRHDVSGFVTIIFL